jgi:hypothetical protein
MMFLETEFGGETMATRDELHRFIDSLPDGLVGEVLDFAQFVVKKAQSEQVARVMAAMEALPEDDEPLTDDELRTIAAAKESARAHGTISMEEMKQDYGL